MVWVFRFLEEWPFVWDLPITMMGARPDDGQTTTSARYFLGFASFASQRRIFLGEKEGEILCFLRFYGFFGGRLVAILVLSLASILL